MQRTKLRIYVAGFIFSLLLTLTAYAMVQLHLQSGHEALTHPILLAWVVSLAIVQLLVQLIFFLHLDQESKPRWNLMALLFAVLVVVIVVFGSLWIMNNLNYNMTMSPGQMDAHMLQQSQKGF